MSRFAYGNTNSSPIYPPMAPLIAQDAAGRKDAHDTYLHANGPTGWPADHKAEDTFDIPTIGPGMIVNVIKDKPEYSAAYTGSGKVILILSTPDRTIGYFDTYADAQLAAEALNNHKGY